MPGVSQGPPSTALPLADLAACWGARSRERLPGLAERSWWLRALSQTGVPGLREMCMHGHLPGNEQLRGQRWDGVPEMFCMHLFCMQGLARSAALGNESGTF